MDAQPSGGCVLGSYYERGEGTDEREGNTVELAPPPVLSFPNSVKTCRISFLQNYQHLKQLLPIVAVFSLTVYLCVSPCWYLCCLNVSVRVSSLVLLSVFLFFCFCLYDCVFWSVFVSLFTSACQSLFRLLVCLYLYLSRSLSLCPLTNSFTFIVHSAVFWYVAHDTSALPRYAPG